MSISQDNFKLAEYIPEALAEPEKYGKAWEVAGSVKKTVTNNRTSNNVNMDKNWDFYQGNHAAYFKQRRDEANEAFKFRKENIIAPNYCKFIIDLSAKLAYGRNGKVRRQFILEDTEKNKKTEQRLRRIDDLVGYQAFMLEAKRHASLFGEQPVRMIPLDERTGEQVSKADRWTYPHPIKLDPRYTFCLVNEWGKLEAVVIESEFTDYVNNAQTKEVIELIVSDSRWCWIDGKLDTAEINQYNLNEEFVCFYNDDTRKDELQYILPLQIKLDETLTDQSHVFEKHGWPQLVTSVDLTNVSKAASYIWEIGEDDDGGNKSIKDRMEFLTWDGKEVPARQYAKDIEAMIFKISSTAPIATGDLENIGQLRSGAALVTSYGPSIQKAQEKQVIWGRNETKFFLAIAMFDSTIHDESLDQRFPGLNIDIRFPEDFVPGEELVRNEIAAMALNSHSVSLRDIIRQRHPEFTEDQVNDYWAEIIEDSEKLTDSKRAFVTEDKTTDQPVSSSQQKSKEQPKQ